MPPPIPNGPNPVMRTLALSLLILALPVLSGLTPDPETVQGHLATCPRCTAAENSYLRCGALWALSRRDYLGDHEVVRSR